MSAWTGLLRWKLVRKETIVGVRGLGGVRRQFDLICFCCGRLSVTCYFLFLAPHLSPWACKHQGSQRRVS